MKQVSLFILLMMMISTAAPLITETYGERFTRAELPTGEWEGVEKMHLFDSSIWLYSKADRKIVRYDTTGQFLEEITLPSIGRSNYLGEDFVMRDSSIYFLNTLDSRLEQFSRRGTFVKSIPYDSRFFSAGQSRSCRIVNQIQLSGDDIVIGTFCTAAVFNLDTGSFTASRSLETPTEESGVECLVNGTRYRLHADSQTITVESMEAVQ